MQLEETLKDIRTRCRKAMNGITSTSMREKGVVYKINFGLVLQQIKEIAERYDKDSGLAEMLWQENTRELRILATMLYPVESFTAETANRWAEEIRNQEIREQVCLNLFQELPFADQLAIAWSNDERSDIRTTGYWLLVRLFLSRKIEGQLFTDYFTHIWEDVVSDNLFLRNSSMLGLKQLGRQSEEEAGIILEKLAVYRNSNDPVKAETYNSVAFEFEFYFGK